MMTNVMAKTCLNQKITKNSNFHDSGNEEERISESENHPKAEFFRKPNLSEYLPNVPKCGLNTRHDNREVALSANFTLWQMRHRFNPKKRVNDYQRYSMLTVLPLRSMSCTLGNSSSLQAAGQDHSCRYYNSLSTQKDILKNFLCIWWWQMLWWKHVFTRKL